ncbi:MAG: hypothetical protein Q7T62_05465 [Undibacterium sp.]|nr:hypothetical protein [Undibacterium sp.]
MNAALTEKMYRAFPYLYRGRTKPQDESAMCYGFECGDGWYQILYDLSQELTGHMLLHPFLDLELMQVKSKFGTLRFHLNYSDSSTEEIISRARRRADLVCEVNSKTKHASDPLKYKGEKLK